MLVTARMANPAFAVPDSYDALMALSKSIDRVRLPIDRELVHLRASQINGCAVCVDMHARSLRASGESEERVWSIAAWRDTPYYSDAERAALALTEELCRMADRSDQVPDDLWLAVAEHFDETQLGALVLDIGLINLWNRVNIASRQIVGEQSW